MNTLPTSLVHFESQLEHALRRQRSRRPRRLAVRVALAAGAAAAVALGVLSVLPGAGGSAVARAAAALADSNGTILHVVLVGTTETRDGATAGMRMETWQSSTPPYDRRDVETVGGSSLEMATADGATQVYDAATNTIYEVPLQKPSSGKAPPADRGTADSYRTKILSLLQSGSAHEDGRVAVDGRDAIRIVSDDGTLQLTVDAATYEPISWRVDEGGRTQVVRFPIYEHLPATEANAALVSETAQHPGAAVDRDQADFEAAVQRLKPDMAAKQGEAGKPEPKKPGA